MRFLIAPDKFKGSLGAAEVGAAIARGLQTAVPPAEIEVLAVADGGEGTAEVILSARHGEWIDCASHDALGRAIRARYGWLAKTQVAVMEMSAAAGLVRIPPNERNPLHASTFGVGEMILDATARGANEIIIGLGGSATNDGGFGMARSLGFRFLDQTGCEIVGSVEKLRELNRIVAPNELQLPSITAACDVTNPLLGPTGATYTFGPQKGTSSEQLRVLEQALTRLAEITAQTFPQDFCDVPGAGAAGGLGFGLLAFCRAQIRSGFEVVAEAIGLREKITVADAVITGEGKLDRQSLAGKAPAGVARMARAQGKAVFAIVGQASNDPEVLSLFDAVMPIDDTSEKYYETPRLLEIHAVELGRKHLAR
jgi:glycerate kinase